ncbi:MAG: 5-carboxymethyl-2-hydroxymuconate isomerase [Pseudomonadales bacterium]
MAHFVFEYSANLDKEALAVGALFSKLHETVAASGIFPMAGMRSRAYCANDYYVANGDPNHAFVHLNFKIGTGRSEQEQDDAFKLVKGVLLEHLDKLYQSRALAISVEMSELPAKLRHNANNVREYIK